MRSIALLTAFLLSTGAALAASCSEITPADVASFPPNDVAAIRAQCASEWKTDFDMRLYCENKHYRALKALIARGSVHAKGDHL